VESHPANVEVFFEVVELRAWNISTIVLPAHTSHESRTKQVRQLLDDLCRIRIATQADVAPLGTAAFLVLKLIKNWLATNNASPIKAAEKMLLNSEVSKPLVCW
jgi:hypothetical protein